MPILEKLNTELKSAMKAQNKVRVNALRLLISDIKKEKIDKGGELSSEQELKVLLTAAKRRKEAIEAYQKGNRQDLVEIERQELAIIEEYLPQQKTDQEIEMEVKKIIEETGASSLKDIGRVMAEAMQRLKGKADGKKVQAMVREKLA